MPTFNLPQILIGFVLSSLIACLAYLRAALTKSGVVGAVLTGTVIFGWGGWDWGLLLIIFFISSSLLTRYKQADKAQVAEQFAKGGPRDLGQALANGGTAALIALAYGLTGARYGVLLFAFVGALAEANADTWATELGVLSAEQPRLITTRKPVIAGTSGGLTWDGIGAALAGAALIGGLGALFRWLAGTPWYSAVLLIPVGMLAGVVGSLVDSLLGATIQGIYYCDVCCKETERKVHRCGNRARWLRGWPALDNDWVNGIATVWGAAIAAILAILLVG